METAARILGLKESEAASLFPGDKGEIVKSFRKLAAKWHPDRNSSPEAKDVFAKLASLKTAALGRATPNNSPKFEDRSRVYKTSDGKTIKYAPASVVAGDLGDVLVGRTTIAYETAPAFYDLIEAEDRIIQTFRFADEGMKREIMRFLPKRAALWETADKKVSVLEKPSTSVLASDLAAYMGGRIPPVHVAWIVSGMLNIACYLAWSGIAHGAISPTTVLISPKTHSVRVVGGWGFATSIGERPRALPERTTTLLPRLALKGVKADGTLDLQLIRATAQELLGAPGGGGLAMDKTVPAAMTEWLNTPPAKNAFEDYAGWTSALEAAFGKRKFVEMNITPEEIYRN